MLMKSFKNPHWIWLYGFIAQCTVRTPYSAYTAGEHASNQQTVKC